METKFRLFDRENKTTVNVKSLEFVGEHIHATSEGSPYRYLIGADADLIRFTGYQDRNGNDIWEGDLLRDVVDIEVDDYVVKWGRFEDAAERCETWIIESVGDVDDFWRATLFENRKDLTRVGSLFEP